MVFEYKRYLKRTPNIPVAKYILIHFLVMLCPKKKFGLYSKMVDERLIFGVAHMVIWDEDE